MRLIDADLLMPNAEYKGKYDTVNAYDIVNCPTVDAIKVVRCKDCKFFDHTDFGKGEEYWCKHFVSTDDTAYCHRVMEDDFCSWAERREDAETD